MPDGAATLADQARQLTDKINAQQAKASAAWATFTAKRTEIADAGVDLTDPSNEEAFKTLEGLSRDFDGQQEQLNGLKAKHASLAQMAHEWGDADKPGSPVNLRMTTPGEMSKAAQTWGRKFIESRAYQSLVEAGVVQKNGAQIGRTLPVEVANNEELKALLISGSTDGTAGSVGAGQTTNRLPGITELFLQPLPVLQLVTMGTTTDAIVEWLVETVWNDNAAGVAENTVKPESDLGLKLVKETVKDIAHLIKTTRQAFRDVGQLETLVNSRMQRGVRRELARQIVSGDGGASEIRGILNTAGILTVTNSAAAPTYANLAEFIYGAAAQVRIQTGLQVEAAAVNPTDVQELLFLKDGNGQYYYGGPAAAVTPRAFGIPLVDDPAITAGSPIVGVWSEYTVWVREGLSVVATDSNNDDFENNRITVRGEMSAVGGLQVPQAFARLEPVA